MSLDRLCEDVQQLAKRTGDFISGEREKFSTGMIKSKGLHDYVTTVDTGAEKMLVEGLQVLLPESGFIAEEGTTSKRGRQHNWIIDPLDGTTNFIHGAPPYAVSVALMQDREVILGVVYEITAGECFYAWKGSPAFMNGREIRVSTVDKLADSLVATGFPYTNFDRIQPFLQSFKYLTRHSHGIRRLGSAATDICYIADGRYDAFYEYGLHAWDVAAAVLILERAGGRSADFSGGSNWLFGGEIVSCTERIYDEFLEIINRIMVREEILI